MVRKVRKVIPFLRRQGMGYGEIAKELNLKKGYVKNFCRIHHIGGFPEEYRLNVSEAQHRGEACLYCGMPLKQPKVGRKRMYCDNACRKRFYYSKGDGINNPHDKNKSSGVATSPELFCIDKIDCQSALDALEALYQKSSASDKGVQALTEPEVNNPND